MMPIISTKPSGQPSCRIVSSATCIPKSFGVTDAPSMKSTNRPDSTQPIVVMFLEFIVPSLADVLHHKDAPGSRIPTSGHAPSVVIPAGRPLSRYFQHRDQPLQRFRIQLSDLLGEQIRQFGGGRRKA